MTLDGLNENQLQAVTTKSPAVLVIAGAGSGKTKALTSRIAHLCETRGVSPYNILALTFTRKAAKEMKERLSVMMGEGEADKMWIGTFHSISLRILNRYGSRLGYQKNITVYDEIDQLDILTAIVSELGLPMKPEAVSQEMQKYASNCVDHEINPEMNLILTEYRNRLKEYNAVDFTLLLTETLRLIKDFPDVFDFFHDKFKYVFIDEYQDTDRTQYYLHAAINPENIFVVGDIDQSIYGWRGSDISIITDFEQQHSQSEVIRLDQSYRCGSKILDAANNLISYNPRVYAKTLWTEGPEGSVTQVLQMDEEGEAMHIAQCIDRYHLSAGHRINYRDFAILTRTHRQHETIAKELDRLELPYKIIGKEAFFWKGQAARMIISVLKILHNKKNAYHFSKIARHILYPMSEAQWYEYEALALRQKMTVMEALMAELGGPFQQLMTWAAGSTQFQSLPLTINQIIDSLPIRQYFQSRGLTTKAMDVDQAVDNAFAWEYRDEGRSVEDFLEWLAANEVQSEIDDKDEIKISTIHAVKGLEYAVVFVAGAIEGTLPAKRAGEFGIEEERRLAYVAITRAKEALFVCSYAQQTGFGLGRIRPAVPSRFIHEMQNHNSERV